VVFKAVCQYKMGVMRAPFGTSSGNILADKRYAYAQDYLKAGDTHAAKDMVEEAITLAAAWPPMWFLKGQIAQAIPDYETAIQAYEHYLSLDPDDHLGARVKLSLITDQESPSIIPSAYVESLFNAYAPRFDESLVNGLSYATPHHIAHIIKDHFSGRSFNDFLDLGCGTGLMGQAVQDITRNRIGVDLSAVMLDHAKHKHIYHTLIKKSLDDFFLDEIKPRYDLILAADVFVYIGDLKNILQHCARLLRTDGIFGFSVQAHKKDERPWILGEDHRFSHTRKYCTDQLIQSGLEIIVCEETFLRKDGAQDIYGYIFMAQTRR